MASLLPLSGALGRARAAHLLRRSTFGPTLAQIEQFSSLSAQDALDMLLDDSAADPAPPLDTATAATWVDPLTNPHAIEGTNSEQDTLFEYFQAWHMDVMRKAAPTLKERITWFFHTHLPARWTEIRQSEAIYYQNCLYRYYALGSFKELFKKICIDNAMLVYLDGYTNRFRSPNENFAREMFELYSIGKGPQIKEGDYTNYTEDDVQEATRVLTGRTIDETYGTIDPDTGLPTSKMITSLVGGAPGTEVATEHDPGEKTFTEKFAGQSIQPSEIVEGYPTVEAAEGELDEMIEMIFAQQETGRFIARKLYRFFVYHFISEEVEADIIEPLSTELMNNDYSIAETLRVLLSSDHFYDNDDAVTANDNIGALIKSPVDLFTGLFRAFDVQFPDRDTETVTFYTDMAFVVSKLVEQGLNFYEPFEVAGYPAYHQVPGFNRNWITTYALAHRYQAGFHLMEEPGGDNEKSFYLDILQWVEQPGNITDAGDASEVMDVLAGLLFSVELDTDRYDYFLYTVFLDSPDEDPAYARGLWRQEWNAYQGGGSADTVRTRLEILLSAMIQTPEFQLT